MATAKKRAKSKTSAEDNSAVTLEETEDSILDEAGEDAETTIESANASILEFRKQVYKDPWQWLSTFTREEWERMMVYCYRIDPFWIIDKTGGKAHYTAKWGHCFDQDDVLKQEGSGGYEFQVVMQPPKGGAFKRLRTFIVNMMNRSYPPNLPHGDWLKHHKNKHWLWCSDMLLQRERAASQAGQPAAAAPPAAAPTDDAGKYHEGLTKIIEENSRRMMELTDPSRQLETMERLAKLNRGSDDGGSTKVMLEMMRDELKTTREQNARLQEKLIDSMKQTPTTAASAAPGDLVTQIIDQAPKLFELAKMLGFKRVRGGEESDSKWLDLFDRVVEAAAPAIEHYFENKNQAAAATGQQGTPPPIQQQQPQQQQPRTVDIEAQAETATEGETMEGDDQEKAAFEAMEPLIRVTVPEMIKALKLKDPKGLQRWFLDEYGRNNLFALRDQFGAERLARFATGHKVLKHMIPDKATVEAFLIEFFDYKDPRQAQQPTA